jgi:EAL domain-containing protein (putative c-di-GMP-specific phosphodiesterase class I)
MRNILNLSEDLGIASLTEGVETEQQYRALAEMGCKLFQGYHFAKPMPIDEFEQFCS